MSILVNANIDELVQRFLTWPMPAEVCADPCASIANYGGERSGTNLLTAEQAKQMIEHVLGINPAKKEFKPLRGETSAIVHIDELGVFPGKDTSDEARMNPNKSARHWPFPAAAKP